MVMDSPSRTLVTALEPQFLLLNKEGNHVETESTMQQEATTLFGNQRKQRNLFLATSDSFIFGKMQDIVS